MMQSNNHQNIAVVDSNFYDDEVESEDDLYGFVETEDLVGTS
jgi:hypothetical protein